MRITSFTLQNHHHCWVCITYFTMTFTDGRPEAISWVIGTGKWRWTAMWKGRRAATREEAKMRGPSNLTKLFEC